MVQGDPSAAAKRLFKPGRGLLILSLHILPPSEALSPLVHYCSQPLPPPSLPLPEFTPCTTEPPVPLPCASLPLPTPQSQPDRALTEPPLSPTSATRAQALTVHSRSCCPSLSHLCRAFIVSCPSSWSSTELYLATPEPVWAVASEPWFVCLLQSDSVTSREPQFSSTVHQLNFQ